MKKFLFHISFYLVAILLYFSILGSFADGNTDDNYIHFSTPQTTSTIFGASRGAQALNPYILDSLLSNKKFYNFSLNITDSPYGPIYFDAIKKKVNENAKNEIFILTVEPWSLSIDNRIKNKEDFPEKNSPLNNTYFINVQPNYEYLAKNYTQSWLNIYRDREENGHSNTYLHKNGWMEVNVNVHPDSINKRVKEKIKFYTLFAATQSLSSNRLQSFKDIIDFLQPHGKVYIVRLPSDEAIYKMEKVKFPEFDEIMNEISKTKKLSYFNFAPYFKNYTYTDGNHMYKESGKKISAQIADSIKLHYKH